MIQKLNDSPSFLRLLLIGTGVVVIVAGLKAFADILSPAIMAGFLALLCVPLYQWLQRKGLRSSYALLLMILILVGVFVALGLLVVSSFRVLLQTLPDYADNIQAQFAGIADTLANLGADGESVIDFGDTAVSLLTNIAANLFSNAIGLVMVGLIILVLLIFIIAESPRYPGRLRRGLGDNNDLAAKISELRVSLINYFVARIKVNTITGVGVFILLLITGVDFALLWAVLAIFLSFIPYFGLVIAAIPAVVLAFAQYGLTMAIIVAVGYLIINQVIEQVIAPKIIADDISLSPALTFFALFFWGWTFDFLGVILAAPLTVLILMILQSYPETEWIAIMAIADDEDDDDDD